MSDSMMMRRNSSVIGCICIRSDHNKLKLSAILKLRRRWITQNKIIAFLWRTLLVFLCVNKKFVTLIKAMAQNCYLKPFLRLPGVLLIIFALIFSDNAVKADVNFNSRPTTVKTFENDSLLLPCYSSTGKAKMWGWHSLRHWGLETF